MKKNHTGIFLLKFTFHKVELLDLIFRKSAEFIEQCFWWCCFNRKSLDGGRGRNSPTEKTKDQISEEKEGRKQTIGKALTVLSSR